MKHRRRVLKILLAGALLFLLLAAAAVLFPSRVLTVDSGPVKVDVMVVLGGGSQVRPQHAAELFQAGAAPRILVTGAGDCGWCARWLETNGVPAADIWLEANARTTFENAKFSIPLLRQMGAHKVIIVTSWYHSRRALACFRHLAPDLQFYSRPAYLDDTGNVRRDLRQSENRYMRLEYPKLLGYWVWHGVCPF